MECEELISSTYLSGRYVSIPVYTLSFAEYLDFKSSSTLSQKELFNEYIRCGGFPIIALGNFDERSSYQITEGIYNSVITNDITRRHNITNYDLFNRVVRYVVENVVDVLQRLKPVGFWPCKRWMHPKASYFISNL